MREEDYARQFHERMVELGVKGPGGPYIPEKDPFSYPTGVKKADMLIETMNDTHAPKWKRRAAQKEILRSKHKYRLMREAIENKEYSDDTIWGIIKG